MQDPLIYLPNDILRQRAIEVRDFSADLKSLVHTMRETMHKHRGMGLAAPQINDRRQIIITEYIPEPESTEKPLPFTVFINPKIIAWGKKKDVMQEGCLSIPYVEVEIERPTEITVIAQDLEGNEFKTRATGLFARILQHEIDHLNGVLILDYEKRGDTTELPRTIVWGSTTFTTEIMNTIRQHVNITHIVTEPPKPTGRKQTLTPTVAKQYAETLGIATIEPTDLNDPRLYSYLLSCKPDLMIVAAYGRLIPENLYTLPRYGTLNVHPSLLPRYRGSTPIQAAILNGDKKTGVTIMQLAPEFDTGAIIAQADYDLTGTETYGELESELAELGAEMIKEVLPYYIKGDIEPIEQNTASISYSKKITAEDPLLNPDDSAELNERKVRAYSPEPGAYMLLDDIRIKVLHAHIQDGKFIPDVVQPAGKKPMSWKDFTNGYRGSLKF